VSTQAAADPNPHQRRRRHVQRAVAAAVATVLALAVSLVLVPAPQSESAPKFNVRCDELIEGIEGIADVADLPGGGLPDAHTETIDDYEYDNPAEKLRPRQQPTQAELDALTGSYEDYTPGTEDHMLRRWKVYEGDYPWERWRNTYIPAVSNDYRGDGYHRNVAKRLKLGGADWMCEDNKLWDEEKLDTRRRYDSVNRRLKIAYELKSGDSPLKLEQLRADQALRAKGWRVVYIFSKEPRPGQVRLLQQYGIEHSNLRSTAVPKTPSPPGSTAMDPRCATTAQASTLACRSTSGPAKQLAGGSGRNAAEAREGQRVRNDLGQDSRRPGFGARRPGGIDWRSLELKYVTDDPKTEDYGYAFSADELPDDGDAEPGFGGEAALDLSSDALFTWLALDPSQFWVNLNPDTPETVIDEQFASTDAGRVLLQADLQFKRTIADGMNPETELGKSFWDSLERTDDGVICYDWYRFWVDPKPATVRQDDGELYILDAPLRAQIEPVEVDWEMPGEDLCAGAPEDVVERNNQRIVDTYAPYLEEAVNTDPVYADLRRVYTARVASEWIKERDAKRPGAFHDVIGTGDVSAWPARTPWDPQEVYDQYLERLQTPLYRYEYEHGDMQYWLEITGGVEFPDAPRDPMDAETFEREHPRLPGTVRSSRLEAASLPVEAQGEVGTLAEGAENTAWLGGGTVQQAEDPDPTDPPDPDPSDPPDPDPTTPPGDGNGGGNDDGGDDGGADDGADDGGRSDDAGRADRQPQPPRAEAPAPEAAPLPGSLPTTGFGDAWLAPAALVLLLAGLGLTLLRRRWRR